MRNREQGNRPQGHHDARRTPGNATSVTRDWHLLEYDQGASPAGFLRRSAVADFYYVRYIRLYIARSLALIPTRRRLRLPGFSWPRAQSRFIAVAIKRARLTARVYWHFYTFRHFFVSAKTYDLGFEATQTNSRS